MEVLALIPARSGSKGVVDKNIRLLNGKPLIAYSIEQALSSKMVNRTIVSTDSPLYAEIAQKHRAEVPFMRPQEIAQDLSTDLEVFQHALAWLKEHENYQPDICLHLRPTHPIREIKDIDEILKNLIDNPGIDSIRSISPVAETPYKMWHKDDVNLLSPVVTCDLKDAYNLPRQQLPEVYTQNACIDAVRAKVIMQQHSMTGTAIMGYVMQDNFDIDTEEQFYRAETYLRMLQWKDQITSGKPKTFCFDIDGVIATLVPDNNYELAQPNRNTIALINTLYELGQHIILFTARGSLTGIDWESITREQMVKWGVKHHKLAYGKPAADFYIDDRFIDLTDLYQLVANLTVDGKEKHGE